MVVRLGVLVAVALDGEVAVHDHELDVAGALLEGVVDGADLVLGHVRVHAQVLVVVRVEVVEEFVRDALVVPALAGQQFARVVVPEAVVVGDVDPAAAGGQDLREEGLGVEVGGLDEDGVLGVAERGQPGFILRRVDAVFVGRAPGLAAYHCDGKRGVGG